MTRARHLHTAGHRFVLISGIVPVLLTVVVAVFRPAPLEHLQHATYDAILRWSGAEPPDGRVVIVDVDERSLATLGQWPWRRDVIARLIAGLHELGAGVVALDVVFAEPDRFAPATSSPSPSDAVLAETFRRSPVVLGYAMTFDVAPPLQSCVMHPLGVVIVQPSGAQNSAPFFTASGAVCNLPVLANAAGASGFLNAAPDDDGILRRVPLIIQFGGHLYPSLALAAVIKMTGAKEVALRVANVDSATLMVEDRAIPLDGRSNLLVRYRGKKRSFRYLSAADVLGGRVPQGALAGALVFVGATALGTREVVATPLDTLFAGVEVQATVADNLLAEHFIGRPEYAATLEAQGVLALGIAAVLVLGRLGPTWGAAFVLALLAGVWAGAASLVSTSGHFLSPLLATVGVVSALATMTVAKFAVERRRADRAGRQTVLTQGLLIQSLLSLTEVRDADTGRHSRRTRRYAALLGKQLATHPRFRDYFTPETIELLASLAPLHDIGKVGVPDRVLNKPSALTPDELVEVRKHPAYGREVILQAERRSGIHDDAILTLAKEIVYTHHERWDGSGYPEGLREEQIPIPGRVMALVDAYDAMIAKRVYCQPKSHVEAMELIVKGRGTHFDPAVVDAFLAVASQFRELSLDAGSEQGTA